MNWELGSKMKNLYIYCEGPTEESFINEILAPYFANLMIFVTPIVCTINCTEVDIYKRMNIVEDVINQDIGQPNCFFNFMLHEFEGILFSSPQAFLEITDDDTVAEIQRMRDEAMSPEHINNSPETAPSKRLESLMPNYAKVKNGTLLSKKMGIDAILKECKHFSEWIEKIKRL